MFRRRPSLNLFRGDLLWLHLLWLDPLYVELPWVEQAFRPAEECLPFPTSGSRGDALLASRAERDAASLSEPDPVAQKSGRKTYARCATDSVNVSAAAAGCRFSVR
jgi:hypothetical protein